MELKAKMAMSMVALLLFGCSSEPNIEVSIQPNQYQYWRTLVFIIQATTNEVVVTNVVVNRGNCALPLGTAKDIERTVKLGFGQSYRGYTPSCTVDDVKEIEVTTNAGKFTFSF